MGIQEIYHLFEQSSGIITDSRKIKKNHIFFALKGANFNGNQYAESAIEQGASYAIIDEKEYEKNEKFICVKNVLKCLQELARYHRRQMNIPIIAITGTNGKTTTKELLSKVLEQKYKIHYTQGNLNNHIGVPLTLLSMSNDTEIGVIEMGANHQGEIDFLCQIAEPNYGLVTNVGKAHLEGFKSFEGVIQTKGELYRYLAAHQGIAFVNREESHLSEMASSCNEIEGYSSNMPYTITNHGANPFLKITYKGQEKTIDISTQLIGGYNYPNVLTAIVIGKYFRVSDDLIQKALSEYTPKNNRSQWIQKGSNEIILDAYNANPTSMLAALKNFDKMNSKNKIAILGDMLELGKDSDKEHQKIIEQASLMNFTQVITVGKEFTKVNTLNSYNNIHQLQEEWDWNNFQNTTFLIKGSRGIRLERLLEAV